jgi:hypothetical protein
VVRPVLRPVPVLEADGVVPELGELAGLVDRPVTVFRVHELDEGPREELILVMAEDTCERLVDTNEVASGVGDAMQVERLLEPGRGLFLEPSALVPEYRRSRSDEGEDDSTDEVADGLHVRVLHDGP